MIERLKKTLAETKAILKEIQDIGAKLDQTYNSRSERWQESEKGEAMDAKIWVLGDAEYEVESATVSIETAIEHLKEYES